MEQLFQWMEIIEDVRQQSKVRHSLKDIIVTVLFAIHANAGGWEEIEDFAKGQKAYLQKYLELKNGIPSHDTIQRAMDLMKNIRKVTRFGLFWITIQAHTSKETQGYLNTIPGRFELVFTPKHGSWLNMIEVFFSKVTKQMLAGIRVETKKELEDRIYSYFDGINQELVLYK